MCFEFPSNVILQRYMMGRTLSIYMICWGIVVLCIGFAQNWTHLMVLRGLQGLFECCISPGFILVVGSWYKTREHASRSLVFQSANAGFGVIASLVMYGLGSIGEHNPSAEPWRYISYFLGSLTIITGCLCLFLLGTPSEVRWLSPEEKKMASARIMTNNTGHDRTGIRAWKWKQARECLIDPCFWFAGINAFLSCVPNGGLTTFGSIVLKAFGFSTFLINENDFFPHPLTSRHSQLTSHPHRHSPLDFLSHLLHHHRRRHQQVDESSHVFHDVQRPSTLLRLPWNVAATKRPCDQMDQMGLLLHDRPLRHLPLPGMVPHPFQHRWPHEAYAHLFLHLRLLLRRQHGWQPDIHCQ